MTRIIFIMGLLLLFVGQSLIAPAQVSNDNEDGVYKVDSRHANDYVPGQVLFKLKDGQKANVRRAGGVIQSAGIGSLDKVLSDFGVQDMEQLLPHATVAKTPRRAKAYNGDMIVERDLTQLYRVVLPEEKTDKTFEMIEQLQQLDEVEFAEPNYKMYIMADDNIAADYSTNPMVSQQWYLDAYGVNELWNKPIINKTRPVIAIIDTGVDITHPDLKDNIWTKEGTTDEHGYDFINNTTKMRDNNKHGTHVAGIAAAANNGVGIVGANPRALIMPITVMQSDGTGDVATIIKGINYAVENSATILNMSLGGYAYSNALRQALENAYQTAVIVAAAGNDGRCIYTSHYPNPHKKPIPMPSFPAAFSFVLGVQATTPSGGLASFSNYDDDGALYSCESTVQDPEGFNYELKAPGTNILSCVPGGSYQTLQGTSMASPLVAGAISTLMMVKQYDNQEILWGELLHSKNIAEAYQQANRPAELDITKFMLRERKELSEETEEDYKKNNEVNTGEIVSIYPVVRTTFGRASNIIFTIADPDGVEVIKGDALFGYTLDAFGKEVSKNPLIIKIPDNMPNATTLELAIQATCTESEKAFTSTLKLKVCNLWTLKGLLSEDKTLNADHVYYVPSDFGINEGVTLTIEPGTRVEFAEDTGLFGFGKLSVNGTPEKPIVFTGHNGAVWSGIYSHKPSGRAEHKPDGFTGWIYMNQDSTLFTLLPTDVTPIGTRAGFSIGFYYNSSTEYNNPQKTFTLSDYIIGWDPDFTGREELLTDPNYLTAAMIQMIRDWKESVKQCSAKYTTEYQSGLTRFSVYAKIDSWYNYTNPTDILSFCQIDGFNIPKGNEDYCEAHFHDCTFSPSAVVKLGQRGSYDISGIRNVLAYSINTPGGCVVQKLKHSNIVNGGVSINASNIGGNNVVNTAPLLRDKIADSPYYLGTGRKDLVKFRIVSEESWLNGIDLSKMSQEPIHEAHGIVWKVLVNGVDPQDEYENMLPLGVGKHKFEVYFNRPMNKAVIPQISFGVISPYNQHPVSEDGSWSADGTIYTAYITIDGKTRSDGMNRIYVHDAEDNEYFPCPYEATRFNIMVQAAGSMATGFQADAGLGCVNLTWNNENNDFEDAMGFNVYRYTEDENGLTDAIRINENILDISATSYIDDNVTPGQTYYYYYKVLSTALQEYDVSNVVAATPLTATRGDANGSGEVDVADVVSTVNYVIGMQPKPFVFDAADMNSDKMIDIFDVVGIIRGILNPSLLFTASSDNETAVYTIENGTLYVESPVSLGGVQVQLTLDGGNNMDAVRVASDLTGFEQASSWLSDTDYLFLAYSMNGKTLTPGKHALLYIGDAEILSLRLSDTQGKKVNAISGDGTTGIDRMGKHVMSVDGIYDLQGRKFSKDTPLKKGVYIINGRKVVK